MSQVCTDDPECTYTTGDPALLLRHRKRKHEYVPGPRRSAADCRDLDVDVGISGKHIPAVLVICGAEVDSLGFASLSVESDSEAPFREAGSIPNPALSSSSSLSRPLSPPDWFSHQISNPLAHSHSHYPSSYYNSTQEPLLVGWEMCCLWWHWLQLRKWYWLRFKVIF